MIISHLLRWQLMIPKNSSCYDLMEHHHSLLFGIFLIFFPQATMEVQIIFFTKKFPSNNHIKNQLMNKSILKCLPSTSCQWSFSVFPNPIDISPYVILFLHWSTIHSLKLSILGFETTLLWFFSNPIVSSLVRYPLQAPCLLWITKFEVPQDYILYILFPLLAHSVCCCILPVWNLP
jgi:hypothetical protein